MNSVFRKYLAVVLASLWGLCILHCLADKAAAHWHIQESGARHHHHHNLFDDQQEHDHGGEPTQGHSHDSEGEECCDLMIRLSPLFQIERGPSVHIQARSSLSTALASLAFITAPVSEIVLTKKKSEFASADLLTRLGSLLAPNAPPANIV